MVIEMEIFQGGFVRRAALHNATHSTMRCEYCDTYITLAQEDYLLSRCRTGSDICVECGEWMNEGTVIVDIHPDSKHLAGMKNTKDAIWYHATNREDWMGDLLRNRRDVDDSMPLVHVGTWGAAQTIISDKYTDVAYPVYLYRVRLAEGAVVDPDIYEDRNFWPTRTSQLGGDCHAFRYVNRWEATGSISLLVDPSHLIIDKVSTVSN